MTPPATVPTLEPDGTVGERPYEGSGREALQKAHKAYAWAEPKKVALPTPVASPYFVEVEFPKVNKQCSLEDNDRSCTDWGSQVSRVKVVEEMALTPTEYEVFAGTLLASRPEHFEDKGGAVSDEDFPEGDYFSWGEADRERFKRTCYTQGILVRAPGKADLVVNPEGYAYARYVGRVVKPKAEPKPDAFDKWAPARAGFKCARWGEA
jgi:hypothetical protein